MVPPWLERLVPAHLLPQPCKTSPRGCCGSGHVPNGDVTPTESQLGMPPLVPNAASPKKAGRGECKKQHRFGGKIVYFSTVVQ